MTLRAFDVLSGDVYAVHQSGVLELGDTLGLVMAIEAAALPGFARSTDDVLMTTDA